MFVMCPLVQNYSVITLDNWYLAYCSPTQSKITKRLFIQQLAPIAWLHSHLLFSYFILLIFVQGKSYKVLFRKRRKSRSAVLIRGQTAS